MARSDAARARQGLHSSGKVTRPKREVGQYGNTRPREDAHVRRARRIENGDARLLAAKEEQEAAEKKLAALDAELAGQVHVPYRPPLEVVPEPEPEPVQESPVVVKKAPAKKKAAVETTSVDIVRARELIGQGYHIARVAELTGVPVNMLKNRVGNDGYRRG